MSYWLFSVIKMQAFEPLTSCSLIVHSFNDIYISRTCFISCWDYIRITYVHEDDKGIRNFNHLSQKINLKHIILSEPILNLFIFSLLYPCVNLKILYVFLFPGQGLVKHILVDISWVMVGNYVEKKK